MRERLLFVPAWFTSPETCETIPALNTAIYDLSQQYDISVFRWPTISGGPPAEPSWQGMVEALTAAIEPRTHLLDVGTGGSLLMLAGRSSEAASFTAAGMITPPATLRSLAMDSLAAAAEFVFSTMNSHQYARLLMQGASEAQWAEAAALIDEDVDWPYAEQLAKSMLELNLVHEKAGLSIPALYLDTPLTVAGFAEMREVFLHFVPHAETGELHLWPAHMEDPEAGKELAGKVKSFIAGTVSQGVAAKGQ